MPEWVSKPRLKVMMRSILVTAHDREVDGVACRQRPVTQHQILRRLGV